MTVETFTITANDILTPLRSQLKRKNASGTLVAFDLTTIASYVVKFKMVNDAGTIVVAETTTGVTVIEASTGKVEFEFLAAHVTTAGTYWGYWTVWSGTKSLTGPSGRELMILIHKDE